MNYTGDDYKNTLLHLSIHSEAAVNSIRKLLAARAGTALVAEKFDLDFTTLEIIVSFNAPMHIAHCKNI